MNSILFSAAALQGTTAMDYVRDIPHDAGAFVVYALLAAFVGFIWHGSRGTPTR